MIKFEDILESNRTDRLASGPNWWEVNFHVDNQTMHVTEPTEIDEDWLTPHRITQGS